MSEIRENRFQNWMLFGIFFLILAGAFIWWSGTKEDELKKRSKEIIENNQRLRGSD